MLPQEYIERFHGGSDSHFQSKAADMGIKVSLAVIGRAKRGEVWPTERMTKAWEAISDERVTFADLVDTYNKARPNQIVARGKHQEPPQYETRLKLKNPPDAGEE